MSDVEFTDELSFIEQRSSVKGKKYYVIGFRSSEGTFFIWDTKLVEEAMPKPGDTLKIVHDGSEYPKVKSLERVREAVQKTVQESASVAQKTAPGTGADGQARFRDAEQIMRTEALKCAIDTLTGKGARALDVWKDVFVLAEMYEKYIKTGSVPEEDG